MEGISISGLTIAPRQRKNRLDDALVADLYARLSAAPVGETVLSGLTRDTKTAAGSDGYAYRNALKDRGVPVVSVTRDVDTIRAAIITVAEATTPPVPALEVPADADAATAKKLRADHTAAVKARADALAAAVPEVYRNAPGKAWTWALVRASEVPAEDAPTGDVDPDAQ